jgi:membrane complex biogenesis BtpA family protein
MSNSYKNEQKLTILQPWIPARAEGDVNMESWKNLFEDTKAIIGMIHVLSLPGTPRHKQTVPEIVAHAVNEAKLYLEAGVDALLVENMHDLPYLNRVVGPEITACMTAIACEIRKLTAIPCGLQILAGANESALAACLASGFDFIRAEGFIFGHLADEGYMDACAGNLLRYRKLIQAEHIGIFTDIKKKHASHALSADVDIADTASAADFFGSDALIITGNATASPASLAELQIVREASGLPIIVGSGITFENLSAYWKTADGFIVGSYFKQEGKWQNPLCPTRLQAFMQKVAELRGRQI